MTEPCRNREEDLSMLLSGDLSQAAEEELRRHLNECEGCRDYYRAIEQDHQSLFSLAEQMEQAMARAETKALRSIEDSASAGAVRKSPIWKVFLRNPIIRLAACLAIVVLGAFLLLSKPTLTLAEVIEALDAQPWVHVKYDNDDEYWYSLDDGKIYLKQRDYICFIDEARNIRHSYFVDGTENIIDEGQPRVYKDGITPPYERMSAWERVVGYLDASTEKHQQTTYAERHSETVDGKCLVRFDRYFVDALKQRLLVEQIWADPDTRLPVRIRKKLQLAFRQEQNREFITGEFDFPESGPSSIYDLGISRDVPIIRRKDEKVDPQVAKVQEKGRAARERFPHRYRVLDWEDKSGYGEINLIYWEGAPIVKEDGSQDWSTVNIRRERYFNMVERYPEFYLPMPAPPKDILKWLPTQTPSYVDISDGTKTYTKHGPHPAPVANQEEPYCHVLKLQGFPLADKSCWPTENQWNYAGVYAPRWGCSLITEDPELPENWLMIRHEVGELRTDYYIDPEHDYICRKKRMWIKTEDTWEKSTDVDLTDLVQLPEGQWYAQRRIETQYVTSEREHHYQQKYNTDIQVLGEGKIPQGAFNGENLLATVKKIETY